MSNIEMKTPSGGSATIKPLDRETNEDFNLPVKGGTLLTKEKMGEILSPSMTGSVTLNGTTDNTVAMADIVTELSLEIGDVIRIDTGAYNKLHTVESITDNSSIIVNYEHAGNRGNGSLKLPDFTGQATVTRVAKWFNCSDSLGRKWVLMPERLPNMSSLNTTGRGLCIVFHHTANDTPKVTIDGVVFGFDTSDVIGESLSICIPNGSTYSFNLRSAAYMELR